MAQDGNIMLKFRKLTEEDSKVVAELLGQLGYKNDDSHALERIERINNEQNGTTFASLNEEGKITGFLQVVLNERLTSETCGEIVNLVVEETERGKGIGTGLIEVAVNWLKDKGCSKLRIRCNTIRTDTHKFYEHLGFTEVKTQKIFDKEI